MEDRIIKFENNELNVRKSDEGLLSLTDLWKLSGADPSKAPVFWQRQEQAIVFFRALTGLLKRDLKSCLTTTQGKKGGTWAHEQIALEYAQYLDPRLAVIVNQNFLDRIEEEKNPDLVADRYIKAQQKRGKDNEWIQKRFEGKLTRNEFTATLARHKVEREGYRNCTNAIYTHLFGGTTQVVRLKKGIDEKSSIRDNLSKIELAAVQFAEMLATEKIEKNNLTGNAQCELASGNASKLIAKTINENRSANLNQSN